MILEPKDLKLDFRVQCTQMLAKANEDIKQLKIALEAEDGEYDHAEQKFEIGTRVEITENWGSKLLGRIWGIVEEGKKYSINRDGYATHKYYDISTLRNLSIGYHGQIEKKLWVAEKLKRELESILEHSEFDPLLLGNQYNIVEIAEITRAYPCDIIEYIHAYNLRSASLKIPSERIKTPGFYEMEVHNNVLIGIRISSANAFALVYNKHNPKE